MNHNSYLILPIKALKDNYIWLLKDKVHDEAWVIDPGDAIVVLETLKQQFLTLKGIILTHHHWDHSGGIIELLNYFPDVCVYSSYQTPHAFVTHKVREDDIIYCGNIALKILEIPGHTLDHTA